MKNREQTAEEIMAELEKNPEFVRRRAAIAERRRQREQYYEALDRPILEQLGAIGFRGRSIDDIVTKYAPLPEAIVAVFLENLQTCQDRRQCEELVRAVGTAESPFDGRVLTDCYDRVKDDDGVRWAILNTIALAKPHSIDDWLQNAQRNPYLRKTLEDLGHSW